jgi:cytoskeletal protein RodZ
MIVPQGETTYRGGTLKQFREKMGVDLKAISQETKINPRILQEIEEEAFEKLPPVVYLKGFLRAYAQSLGLDPPKVIEGYLQFLKAGQTK